MEAVELERAKRLFAQKVDRLRASRERLHKAKAALDSAVANIEHDLLLCLAAAEDIEQDKDETL